MRSFAFDYVEPPLWRRAWRRVLRLCAGRFYRTPLTVPSSFRGVSFCFDDFPASAASGAQILEEFGDRGTFYTCFPFAGQGNINGPIATLPQIKALALRGHEIGCHTGGHLDCALTAARKVEDSCRLNRRMAKESGIPPLVHFAYPEGGVSPASKKLIRSLYTTARSVLPGVNKGVCDSHFLKATALYGSRAVLVPGLIEQVAREGGWLILYTHDVADHPSPFGTTREDLRRLIAHCHDKDIPIQTIGQTWNAIMGKKEDAVKPC